MDPFQEFVDSLKRILVSTQTSTSLTNPVPVASAQTITASPMVNPTSYSGLAEACNEFLLQCSLALEMHPHRSPTKRAKMAIMLSLLTGRVLQWAESLWQQNGQPHYLSMPSSTISNKCLAERKKMHQLVDNYTISNKAKPPSRTTPFSCILSPLLVGGMSSPC